MFLILLKRNTGDYIESVKEGGFNKMQAKNPHPKYIFKTVKNIIYFSFQTHLNSYNLSNRKRYDFVIYLIL